MYYVTALITLSVPASYGFKTIATAKIQKLFELCKRTHTFLHKNA